MRVLVRLAAGLKEEPAKLLEQRIERRSRRLNCRADADAKGTTERCALILQGLRNRVLDQQALARAGRTEDHRGSPCRLQAARQHMLLSRARHVVRRLVGPAGCRGQGAARMHGQPGHGPQQAPARPPLRCQVARMSDRIPQRLSKIADAGADGHVFNLAAPDLLAQLVSGHDPTVGGMLDKIAEHL